jgi:hypothetical protein
MTGSDSADPAPDDSATARTGAYPIKTQFRTACVALAISIALPGHFAFAQDWPQWRGRDRDGVVHGVPTPKHWSAFRIEPGD